ncbi:MAG: DUF1573 domain-containing protein [Prolixibacteraceae bacterium]|jgi:hypothetical protein|nr:DUF1573 domain-containing protein [Prolixibacteraceae bacterium]MDI9562631.1 DUF1573 domain-containing protein [Bacteroidota bacterium]NLT00258.1 DUF1573 domain-containing protein [Bacteroidales bacterium]OQB79107.1 MAG: hypothetical protein BWX87_02336 [Bacteroidetes bacterium ADurb.Bin123]HNU77742.1 DUF1573 domain-containing protein [Prolixibacteraceae bacterium]
MKRFTTLFFVLLLGAASNLVIGQPKLVFDKTDHNFGSFKESAGPQTATFEFTNKGTTPLILNSVNASCGCTTPEWTRQPVAPGARGMIKVSYNPANRPGAFSKSVTVNSNAENPTVMLVISGKVEEREKTIAELYPREIGSLRAKQNHISFPTIKNNEVKTETLELVNDTDKPVVVGFKTIPKHITVTVEPENIPAKGKGLLTMVYDAKAANTYGFTSHRIYLTLDGSNDYKNSIGVSATIEEDFSSLSAAELANAPVALFNTLSYDFGDIKQGDKKEYTFELKNGGKRELLIRNVRSSCGCTAVSPSKNVIAPGETAPIKVVFDSTGKKGRQSKTVTVITNDPKNSSATLRISTNIL